MSGATLALACGQKLCVGGEDIFTCDRLAPESAFVTPADNGCRSSRLNLVQDKLTIVLVGSFNPAILTPQWIARNALGYPEERQFQVELLTPVAGIGGMPRYSF